MTPRPGSKGGTEGMVVAWVLMAALFSVSWFVNRERTLEAARLAWSLFREVLPMFVIVLVFTSLSLGLISEAVSYTHLDVYKRQIRGLAGSTMEMPTRCERFDR